MLKTIMTLVAGSHAQADETLRDIHALPLIDQKIRETEANLRAAKITLASLIQRHRSEIRLAKSLDSKIADMTTRAKDALKADNSAMATEAANAIATMENARTQRQSTIDRLDQKTTRLRNAVEAGQRRLVDLKQGAVAARAVRNEQRMQGRLRKTFADQSSADEAEALIAKVLGQDDVSEQADILREIEEDVNHDGLADRMAAQGFGPATKSTGANVLARLQSNTKKPSK